jgi:hypothetical protein
LMGGCRPVARMRGGWLGPVRIIHAGYANSADRP